MALDVDDIDLKARRAAYHHEWYLANRDRILSRRRTNYAVVKVKLQAWRKANQAHLKQYDAKAYKANRDKILEQHRQRSYGLGPVLHKQMLVDQNHQCAICLETPVRLDVDHNHHTGEVRALLCQKCNRGLGQFNDNEGLLIRAAQYLRKHVKS